MYYWQKDVFRIRIQFLVWIKNLYDNTMFDENVKKYHICDTMSPFVEFSFSRKYNLYILYTFLCQNVSI